MVKSYNKGHILNMFVADGKSFSLDVFKTKEGQRHAERVLNFGDKVRYLLNRKMVKIKRTIEKPHSQTFKFYEREPLPNKKYKWNATTTFIVWDAGNTVEGYDFVHAMRSPYIFALAIHLKYLKWKQTRTRLTKWFTDDGYTYAFFKRHYESNIEIKFYDKFGRTLWIDAELFKKVQDKINSGVDFSEEIKKPKKHGKRYYW